MKRGAVNLSAVLLGLAIGAAVGIGGLALVVPVLRGHKTAPTRPLTSQPPPPAAAASPPAPAAPRIQVDLARLNSLLMEGARRIPGTVAAHVRLDDGGYAGVRADEPMPAASLIKAPIMAALHDAWKSGALTRTTKDAESLRQAITVSDNPAADWLIDRLGTSQINAWLDDHGYPHTRLRHKMQGPRPSGPNVTTAEDLTRLMLEIAQGKLISAEASAEMRSLLLAQTRRTRIPAGTPPLATVGNKTGTLRGVVNDAAFVETPEGRRYAIAILVSNAGGDASTSRAVARLSGEVYALISSAPAAEASVATPAIAGRD
jgi:beta-lactamase class A